MVASEQMIRPFRCSRIPGLLVLVGCLFAVPPRDARASSEIVAARLAPSSVSARYGPAVRVNVSSQGALYLVPSGTGVELRRSDATSDTLLDTFRTAGVVNEVAWSGTTAYLLAGDRGIVAVDASTSSSLVAIGSHDHLGTIQHGAFAPSSGTLAAATDQTLHFFREQPLLPGQLQLLQSRVYTDGRRIVRVRARADSFLVLSLRTTPTLRMILTLYRVRSAAAPESLWEFQANGLQVEDLAWPDAIAFIAAGNAGILPVDTETRLAAPVVPVNGGRFVRALDADASSVVAVGEARTYAQFTRSGPKGRTPGSEVDRLTSIDPFHVSLVGGLALAAEDDQATPNEPDEVAASLLETFDVGQPGQPARSATTGTGRARRVLVDAGLAYVADYSGGLRIYRAGSADTSLVGALPLAGNARAFDLALDTARHILYLAAGTGGVVLVDVTDPAAPVATATVTLPGLTVAVASIDTTLAVAGRRGGASAGVTFLGVSTPAAPLARGTYNFPFVQDIRALASRDTVLFVADDILGLLSLGFGNPDSPVQIGPASGVGARGIHLSGTLLLVGTGASGVQVADVTNPVAPTLLATIPCPPVFGVERQGQTGIALLGDGGGMAIDLRVPSAPRVRGMIQVPGFSRDAAWAGDTLLIAESFGLERYRASATVSTDPALSLSYDPGSVLGRVDIVWFVPLPPGAIGWNVYRDPGSAFQGQVTAAGVRVNDSLLAGAVHAAVDYGLSGGTTYRYRLEAFFPDGSSLKAAEGSIFIPSNSALGRPYPNPYRPRGGQILQIPYRVLSVDGGKSIQLHVFDANGRLVREIESVTPPGGGFATLSWDGRNDRGRLLADGVYFVKLNGPGIDDARQLILLR